MNAHRMFTRRPGASLLVALVAGLLAQQAMATEGVVAVLAVQPAAELQVEPESVQTELKEYLRSVNEEMRIDLESSFKQRPAPQLQLAAVEISTRG